MSVNLSKLPPATRQRVVRGLHFEDKAKHDLGVLEQLRLKRLMDQTVGPGFNTEIGRTSMVMSQAQRNAAMRTYGQMCFADPDFGKFLLKHHADFRVKDVGTRIQSGYTGPCSVKSGRSAAKPTTAK